MIPIQKLQNILNNLPTNIDVVGIARKGEEYAVVITVEKIVADAIELPELRLKMVVGNDLKQLLFETSGYDWVGDIEKYPEVLKNTPHSFYNKTLTSLGLTEEHNDTGVSVTSNILDYPATAHTSLFSEDDKGNMIFFYSQLDGSEYTYDNGNKNNPVQRLHVIRYKKPKPYTNEKGETEYKKYHRIRLEPYFLPNIIKAVKEKTVIDTLYFVEGEKKAIAGWQAGLYMIGLGGIHGFYDKHNKGQLNPDIAEAITLLNPEEVVFLTDADTMTVNYEEGKEMSKRPTAFKSAVSNFRDALAFLLADKNNRLNRISFVHQSVEFVKTAKGLDDLYAAFPKEHEHITADLQRTHSAKRYFRGIDLTNYNDKNLTKFFGLSDPKTFYDTYSKVGEFEYKPFVFKHIERVFDKEKGELVVVKHKDTEMFFFIGDKTCKLTVKPLFGYITEVDITKFAVGEIKRRYGKHFVNQLPMYDGITVRPATPDNYERVITIEKNNKLFTHLNMFEPITHIIKQGEFPNTVEYLKHIFGGEATIDNDIIGDTFTLGLDWLTILWQHPTRFLPVLLLLSEEQGTGKTTMIDWLQAIYETNLVNMRMEQFLANFNKLWAFKLLRCIDEGSLDLDKNNAKNTFKNITTGKNIPVEFKGIDTQTVPNYGKMIICSNDENNVMRMENDDTRFFPIKVPVLKQRKVDFLQRMIAEIPAWLYYLSNRKIAHPDEDRLWFKTDYIKTAQFYKIVEKTRPVHEQEIDFYVKNVFLTFYMTELRFTINFLLAEVNKKAKYKISERQLRDYLEKKGYTKAHGNSTIKIPMSYGELNRDIIYATESGRFYRFLYTDWLNAEEQQEFLNQFEKEEEFVPKPQTQPNAASNKEEEIYSKKENTPF